MKSDSTPPRKVARITGITGHYGPGDNFHATDSHVLPAMIRRFHEAARSGDPHVTCSASVIPRRGFLHVDDLARACLHLLEAYNDAAPINVGVDEDVSIPELAELVASVVGFDGEIRWDAGKPDGTPRKLLHVSRIMPTGWRPEIPLPAGVSSTYVRT